MATKTAKKKNTATPPAAPFTGPELCKLTATEVVTLLRKGEIAASEALDAALTRIAQVEQAVNAMPTVCAERARASLKELGKRKRANGDHVAWLAGLPIGIKDLTPVKGVRCTFGTKGFADKIAAENDPIVDMLEARGATVVGMTNTPEMGTGANTFNDVFGRTRNPWDTRKNAGGSSGGAAVSLATGEVWLSHGSDFAGSLRTPAAYCGIVGLRPSPGRAGGAPSVIAFHTDGVMGPMARTVADVALFLDAMAGFDPRMPITLEAPAEPFQQAVRKAKAKVRIAYAPTLGGFAAVEPEIDTVLRNALAQVERAGGRVEEACPELPDLLPTFATLRGMAWASLPGSLPPDIQRHFKKTLRENIALGYKLKAEQIYEAFQKRAILYFNMHTFLSTHDVLACPVVGLEPLLAEEEYPRVVAGKTMETYIDWLRFSFLATTTGLPAISVPVGFTKSGMPVGLQMIGPPRGEAKLLAVARAVEAAVKFPTTPIDPRTP
ncbi:MAG: amidase [Hyphomicrobiales bacterium]|nr:MAG: amidase [Hyphomicrobiales bacterium]